MIRHRDRSDPAAAWRKFLWTLPAVVAICVGVPATAQDAGTATYRVTFTGNWTTESTPGGVVSSAHFTTLIGAVHNSNVTFWQSGGMASAGIESMAETGGTGTLRSEIQASAHVHSVIQRGVSFGGTGTAAFDLDVPDDHPLITLTSMIGPSPDWFVGINGLSLLDGQGNWRATVQVDLYPYDAGTEDGTEFTLSNSDTDPQENITSIRNTGKFSDEPMARLSFVLDTTGQPPGRVTGVAVTPGIGALIVSWDPVDNADGYKVQWRSAGQTFGSARERVVGDSITQDTIPNLAPGTQYFVRVIATRTGTDDGTPSNAESGTPLAAVNQPPEITSQIAMQFLEVGGSVRIGLSNHFRDPEGRAMTFRAVSDNTGTATASVRGSVLTVRGVTRGGASVTVTARDSGGLTATQSFHAMVGRTAFFATTSASAPEGGTARLTVRLSRASNTSTSLEYVFGRDSNPNTSDANAADYQGAGGTVAISARQTEAVIEITIRQDIDIEPAKEVFTVGLAVPAEHQNNVALGAATATVTIDEGVCDRTPQVRDALRGAAACSAVSTADLDGRESLVLANMGIDALQSKDFDYLPGMRNLDISGNRLQTLPSGLVSGLENLLTLRLDGNSLTELRSGALANLYGLRQLRLDGNNLQALPDGLFHRVPSLAELQLHDNPGAPFVLTLELARTDAAAAAPDPATVVATVAKGAPFAMRQSVSASNGELSANSVAVLPGNTAAAPIMVTRIGEGAARVTLDAAPPIPTNLCGDDSHPCFRGIATAVGPTLVLFKNSLRATDFPPALDLLASGDEAIVDLTTLFTGAEGEILTYAVESSNPELVVVSVEGTNLVLLPNEVGEEGAATVTVTATDADGLTATLSFVITIEANPQSFLRGWRKALFDL